MIIPITLPALRTLLARDAQLVEVLPPAEYAEQHLPGAVSIPLKTLAARATAGLDRNRPVIVYCWDQL
ncbi:MAG: rhodanese-like domain-containing protein [Thermoleophilia bacterium]